jgi:uncharacterized iron-regulated protein
MKKLAVILLSAFLLSACAPVGKDEAPQMTDNKSKSNIRLMSSHTDEGERTTTKIKVFCIDGYKYVVVGKWTADSGVSVVQAWHQPLVAGGYTSPILEKCE